MRKLASLVFILLLPLTLFRPLIVLGDSTNLALHKPTTQSSVDWGGLPERAVDGNTSGNFGDGSVTHTRGESNPWWEVDLGTVESVTTIRLWNRTDYCCSERLNNFYVYVSGTPFSTTAPQDIKSYYYSGIAPRTTDIPVHAQGRYVRIQIPGNNQTLSLAEVEVLQSSDTIAPTGSIAYSTTAFTNKAVVATLTTSEEVTITNNGGSPVYTFQANGSFTFEFYDEAGNRGSTVATVSNIDRTAPVTTDDAPESSEGGVTVTLTATDDLSVVEATYYQLNHGDIRSGTSIPISRDGVHELKYWSVDIAGNVEEPRHKTIQILAPQAPSLSSLSLSAGKLDFHQDITLYRVAVPADLTSVTITPVASNSNLTIQVNGQRVSGSASTAPLAAGGNRIAIELLDADEETQNTYTIMVMRPSRQPWDIGDTVRAINSEFDINNDGTFTVQDVTGLLEVIWLSRQ